MSTTSISKNDATLAVTNGKCCVSYKRRKKLSCFNVVMALIFLQILSLLVVFSRSKMFPENDEAGWHTPNLVEASPLFSHGGSGEDSRRREESAGTREARRDINTTGQPNGKEEKGNDHAIDNYYARKHITREIVGIKVPLVLGGSDGSGTRAFVDILGRLGVPMLVDDVASMDVHGNQLMFGKGWPPLVSAILKETRSSNYNFSNLSERVKSISVLELSNLIDSYIRRGENLVRNARAKNVTTMARDISFGFKVPVSMLLVPVLQQVMGPMKYLHIVRDGRDVALSSNQSPVKKFYSDTYADGPERLKNFTGDLKSVLGMQLWNDWNTGLLEYERQHSDGIMFDFLVMRTEDLLNPESRFKSLVQLSHFVGSPRALDELCCLSRQVATDKGESANFTGHEMDRFGNFRNPSARKKVSAAIIEMRRMQAKASAGSAGGARKRETLAPLRRLTFIIPNSTMENDRIGETLQLQLQSRFNNDDAERKHKTEGGEEVQSVVKTWKHTKYFESRFQDRLEGLTTLASYSAGAVGRRRLSEVFLVESTFPRDHSVLDFSQERLEQKMAKWNTELVKARQRRDKIWVEHLTRKLSAAKFSLISVKRKKSSSGQATSANWGRTGKPGLMENRATTAQPKGTGGVGLGSTNGIRTFRFDTKTKDVSTSAEQGQMGKMGEALTNRFPTIKVASKARPKDVSKARPKDVAKRYGKWVHVLRDQPEVLKKLHEEGVKGLEAFGYEPPRKFQDTEFYIDFVCDDNFKCV